MAPVIPGYGKYNGTQGTTLKGGCGLYIREGLSYKDRKELDVSFYDDLNEFQTKTIEIIMAKSVNILLSVTYRHPKKTSNSIYVDQLKETLTTVMKEHKIYLSLGDFNYNLYNHDSDIYVANFIESMYSHNMQPTINIPTRVVKGQKPSLLDNIFSNAIDKETITGNLIAKITDHMPNFIILKNITLDHKSSKKKVRNFKSFDHDKYHTDVNSIDLSPVLQTEDINIIYKYFHDQLVHIINFHAPYIELSRKQSLWARKPWIDRKLQKLIEEKNKLYRKYIAKNKDVFWFNRYKTIKKSCERLIQESKKKHFAAYFTENLNNSKKVWQGINDILRNKNRKENSEIYLDEKGSIITDQKIVSNKFNQFYTNVARNLLKDLGETPTKYQDYLRNPNEHSIFFNETDPGEISEIISKLDISKSGDVFGITPKVIKSAPSIAVNLSTIFNISITQGVFPHMLKIAKGDSKKETHK